MADYNLGIYDNKDKVEVVIIYKRAMMYAMDDGDAGDDTQDDDIDKEVENFPPTVLVISFGRFKREDDLSIKHSRDGQVGRKLKFTKSIKLDSFWRDLTDDHNQEVDQSNRTHSSIIINTIASMRSDLTEMKEKVGSYQELNNRALSNTDIALELLNQAKEAMNGVKC